MIRKVKVERQDHRGIADMKAVKRVKLDRRIDWTLMPRRSGERGIQKVLR
jgi:hypothetical protein